MASKWQKEVKGIIENTTEVSVDRIVCKRDGSVEVRRCYFYRHGYTAEKYMAAVNGLMKKNGIEASYTCSDQYNEWPKDIYFSVIVAPQAS